MSRRQLRARSPGTGRARLHARVKPLPSNLARGTARCWCVARVHLMFLAAVGAAVASPTATRAESASAPDSAHMALVRFALLNFADVRVVAGRAKLLGQHGAVSP